MVNLVELFVIQEFYLLVAIALGVGPALLLMFWWRWQRREKRSPICRDILRGPGESLRIEIARLDEQINDLGMFFCFTPIIIFISVVGVPTLGKATTPAHPNFALLIFLLALALPIPLIKLKRRIRERANYCLGLDAELAVGRELNLIMREGYYVFHDFPEEHNNIDHVVVGPSGVFALETKGRAKPDKGRGGQDAKVIYNGTTLCFPDNVIETAAIAQARKQAGSLAKWLSSAVGEPVKVRPVLALPGWFVERKKPDDLILLVGQHNNYAQTLNGPVILSETMIKRIVHQLEAKCRDVAPQAYQFKIKKTIKRK